MDADPDLAPLASLRLILLAIQRQERIRAMDPMPSEKSAEAISGPPSSGDGEAYGIPIDGVQHQGGRKMRPRKISIADRGGIGAGIRSCCWLGCRTIMKTPLSTWGEGAGGEDIRADARKDLLRCSTWTRLRTASILPPLRFKGPKNLMG